MPDELEPLEWKFDVLRAVVGESWPDAVALMAMRIGIFADHAYRQAGGPGFDYVGGMRVFVEHFAGGVIYVTVGFRSAPEDGAAWPGRRAAILAAWEEECHRYPRV